MPVFLPTTLQNVDQIVEAISALKAKLPPGLLPTEDIKPDLIGEQEEDLRESTQLMGLSSRSGVFWRNRLDTEKYSCCISLVASN